MSVYQRGSVWWYSFTFAGRHYQESSKSQNKSIARDAQKARRRELELGYNGLSTTSTNRKRRLETIAELSVPYLEQYRLKRRAPSFAECCIRRLLEHVGSMLPMEINADSIAEYQSARLKQQAAPKSINEEVTFLLRLLGPRGDLLRSEMHKKEMRLAVPPQPGKAFSEEERDRLKLAAEQSSSPHILFALSLALNLGMRDSEMRNLQWEQIDFKKGILTVGRSKTEAGEGRTIPLNSEVLAALRTHVSWYTAQFGALRPEWYVFPGGSPRHLNQTRPVGSFQGSWETVKRRAGVTGRWHDCRHTLITELAESGCGDQTILDVAGHVSRQMLARYSHIRTQAKRDALELVVTRRQKARQDAATK
jgi:integrase